MKRMNRLGIIVVSVAVMLATFYVLMLTGVLSNIGVGTTEVLKETSIDGNTKLIKSGDYTLIAMESGLTSNVNSLVNDRSGEKTLLTVGKQPQIELNGSIIQAAAYIDKGVVYLPLQAIAQTLGYVVKQIGTDNAISVTKPGLNILIDLKNERITVNDHAYYISGDYSGNVTAGGKTNENETYMGMDFYSENMGLKVQWDKKNEIVRAGSVQENVITIKTVKTVTDNDKIKITLQYPQIQGMDDKTVQNGINDFFVKTALNAADEGQHNVDLTAEDNAVITDTINKFETYFDYRIKYNQNGLLSVVFTNYQYTGGAHGATVQSSHTFDLKTGKEYNLKDIFKKDADYVIFISKLVRDEMNEKVKEEILPGNSVALFKAIKADQSFYLSNSTVVLYFQEYEYFPYAAGIQEFQNDYSALKDIIKSDFNFLNQ